jgi:hypothetical protein
MSSWPLLDDVIGPTLGMAQHDVTDQQFRDDVKMADDRGQNGNFFSLITR